MITISPIIIIAAVAALAIVLLRLSSYVKAPPDKPGRPLLPALYVVISHGAFRFLFDPIRADWYPICVDFSAIWHSCVQERDRYDGLAGWGQGAGTE